MTMIRNALASALVALSGAAAAQDLPVSRAVEPLLFAAGGRDGVAVAINPAARLSAQDANILAIAGAQQLYYGALAFSLSNGIRTDVSAGALNYHSLEAARRAALAECNSRRKSGDSPCVVAAEIVPKDYAPGRALQLSQTASDEFRRDYRRIAGPKAFAVSEATGQYGWAGQAESPGAAQAAALAACAARAQPMGGRDCKVISAD